jgi:hypothetical protein
MTSARVIIFSILASGMSALVRLITSRTSSIDTLAKQVKAPGLETVKKADLSHFHVEKA